MEKIKEIIYIIIICLLCVALLYFITNYRQQEIFAPPDRITKQEISQYPDKFCIKTENYRVSSVLGSHSMLPSFDENSNVVYIPPNNTDILIGDIVIFKEYKENNISYISHRVVNIKEDEEGKYYVTQGDNNPVIDPKKVRLEDIIGVVIAIIY